MTPKEVLDGYFNNKQFEIYINNQWVPVTISSLKLGEIHDICQRDGLRYKRIVYKKHVTGTGTNFKNCSLSKVFELEDDKKYTLSIKEIME